MNAHHIEVQDSEYIIVPLDLQLRGAQPHNSYKVQRKSFDTEV